MYNELIQKIKEYDNIVIARHIGPDPDCLCSQLALRDSILLTYPLKKVSAIGMGSSRFLSFGKLDKYERREQCLLIVCDTPDIKRIDTALLDDFSYVIKLDHHPFIEKFGDLEIIDENLTSTCELIMKIIYDTELQCNSSISELLYMGLASDSNRFLFNSCTSETFSLVSYYLKNYPFDLSRAYQKLYIRPLNEVRLEGYISLHMIVNENQLGYIVISDDVICEYEVDSASAGNMVNNFNYIKEVLVWATITEDVKNSIYRVSVRSRGPEINHILELHHGGGHKYASGARVKSFEEAMSIIDDLDKELKKYLEKE